MSKPLTVKVLQEIIGRFEERRDLLACVFDKYERVGNPMVVVRANEVAQYVADTTRVENSPAFRGELGDVMKRAGFRRAKRSQVAYYRGLQEKER